MPLSTLLDFLSEPHSEPPREDFLNAAKALRSFGASFEAYMPIRSQREAWDGDSSIAIAFTARHDGPVSVILPNGSMQSVSRLTPPSAPVLLIQRAEQSFGTMTRDEPVNVTAIGHSSAVGTLITSTRRTGEAPSELGSLWLDPCRENDAPAWCEEQPPYYETAPEGMYLSGLGLTYRGQGWGTDTCHPWSWGPHGGCFWTEGHPELELHIVTYDGFGGTRLVKCVPWISEIGGWYAGPNADHETGFHLLSNAELSSLRTADSVDAPISIEVWENDNETCVTRGDFAGGQTVKDSKSAIASALAKATFYVGKKYSPVTVGGFSVHWERLLDFALFGDHLSLPSPFLLGATPDEYLGTATIVGFPEDRPRGWRQVFDVECSTYCGPMFAGLSPFHTGRNGYLSLRFVTASVH